MYVLLYNIDALYCFRNLMDSIPSCMIILRYNYGAYRAGRDMYAAALSANIIKISGDFLK